MPKTEGGGSVAGVHYVKERGKGGKDDWKRQWPFPMVAST
jgi:hypothetical protein